MFLDKLLPTNPSVKRHIAKTITWRIVGTLDTVVLGWIVSGNPWVGIKIGGLEVTTKMLLYYFHERVWYRINFGLPHRDKKSDNTFPKKDSEIG
jgi:uncharacterized membrane protein